MKKRIFPTLAMLILCLSLLFVTASAEDAPAAASAESVIQYDSIDTAVMPELPPMQYSLNNGTVMIADSTAVQWIDRIDIGSDDSDPIRKFYNTLVEYTDNDGQDDRLIDVSQSDVPVVIEVVTVTGNLVAQTQEAAQAELDAKAGEVFAQYSPFIAAAYYAFNRDHPEVFWLHGGINPSLSGSTSGRSYSLTLSAKVKVGTDYSDAAKIETAIADLNSAVNTINAGLPTGSNTYETLRYYNEWLTDHNEYCTADTYVDYTRNPLTALKGSAGTAGPVCEGYARAFKVLCDRKGIPCVLVDGYAKSSPYSSGEGHMWNYVQLSGNWYAVDVTWNDPIVGGGSGAVSGGENEDYFLVGGTTTVDSMAFLTSHPVSNEPSPGIYFPDGPVLSADKYAPTAVEPDCQLSATLDGNGILSLQLTDFSPGTVCFAAYSISGKLLEIHFLPDSAATASATFTTQALAANEKPNTSNAGKIAFAKAFVLDTNNLPLHTIDTQILGNHS